MTTQAVKLCAWLATRAEEAGYPSALLDEMPSMLFPAEVCGIEDPWYFVGVSAEDVVGQFRDSAHLWLAGESLCYRLVVDGIYKRVGGVYVLTSEGRALLLCWDAARARHRARTQDGKA